MSNKLKVGIFGIGHNHAAEAIAALKRRDDVTIVGLFDPDELMLLKRLGERPDVYSNMPVMSKDMLFGSGLDIAMVESSVPYLVPTALECAEHGLHVHMDKPAGTDLPLYKKLLDTLEKNRRVFQTGYMYRYNAGVRYLTDRVEKGVLGRIYNITAQMSTKHPVWFKKQLLSYGVKSPVMFIFGGHLIDLCLRFKGEPQKLDVFGARSGDDGIDFEDSALAVMSYADGFATVKVSSSEINGWGMREFSVYGENGTISLRPLESALEVRETLLQEHSSWKDIYRKIDIKEEGRYDLMMKELVEAVRSDIHYNIDFKHEYMLQKLTRQACGYDV